METYKNRVEAALAMIAQKQLNPTDVERICGVNRTQIYRWKSGEVKQMRPKSFDALVEKLGYKAHFTVDTITLVEIELNTPHTVTNNNIGDLTMNQQQMLIKYQQQEIQQLKNKINQHEDVYGGIQSDIVFSFNIKFNWSLKNPGLKVQYLDQTNNYLRRMAEKLGYTSAEMSHLLQIGEMVEYKDHNIHTLRNEEQKKEMLGVINNFMNAYKRVKLNTTLLIAEVPVLYTHKNGTVFKSNVEYRVNWVKGTGTAHIRWLND